MRRYTAPVQLDPTCHDDARNCLSHVAELRLRDTGVEAARQKLMAGESLSQEEGVRVLDARVMVLGATYWRLLGYV